MSFAEFWPHYLAEHSRAATRWLHLGATLAGFGLLGAALLMRAWWLLAVILPAAYGITWSSHFFVEGNHPATFRRPLLSLVADHKMAFLLVTGQLGRELERLRIAPRR